MPFHFLRYTVLALLLACFTAVTAQNACGPPARREREEPIEELNEETYAHKHTIAYKCRPGYAKAWPIRLECNNGVWKSLSTKNCTGISCGSPGDSDYASFELVKGEDFTFGARVIYTCNEGYKMLSQYNYRDCRANGWTNEIPHCEINKCPPIATPSNMRIIQGAKYQINEDFSSGDLVIFGCIGNLKIKGSNKIICTANGSWSATVPECIEITCQPEDIDNGQVSFPKPIYKEGERIRFSCNEGYTYVDRPDALCSETGWSTKLECKEIQCFPPEVANGRFEPRRIQNRQNQFTYNDEIETICNEGFVFEGRKFSKCTASGWEPPTVCKRKGCNYVPIENGIMQRYPGRFPKSEGEYFQFWCNDGFLAKNKERRWQTATCTKSRFEPEPKCFKHCDHTAHVDNGHFLAYSWSKYIEGDNITLSCSMGYYPENQQSTITCTKNGWSPAPKCMKSVVQTTCKKVSLSNGNFESRKQTFQINVIVKYNCHPGYTTSKGETEAETRCLMGGWSPEPECIKTCLKPSEGDFIFNTTQSVFFPGDELHYECKEGFENTKNTIETTVSCTEKGWERTPSCEPIICRSPFLENGIIDPRKDVFQHKMVVHFKCYKGFTRVGSESAQCYHFGWSPQPPICKANVKPCPASRISHGLITVKPKPMYQHGVQLEVQCEVSFALHGSKIIECVDGEWAPLPSCTEEVKTCKQPPTIKNGRLDLNTMLPTYRHGETVEYKCQEGSVITGTNPAKCLHGQWELPSCLETCPPPPQLPNAINVADMRIYRSEEEISFKCQEHFLLHGPQKIKCEDGKWQTPPRCLDLRCKPPPQIDNGTHEIENGTMFFPGDIVEYRCSLGFEISQLSTVRCENGKWSELPFCKEKSCGPAPEIPNASLEQEIREQYDSGKIINYTCNRGFDPEESTKITCRRGEWEGSFTCKDVRCSSPEIQNAEIIDEIKAKYLPREKVRIRCNTGYSLLGSPFITCSEKGWIEIPRCTGLQGRCGRPPFVENGDIVDTPKLTYLHSESVFYQCQNFYTMEGSSRVTCQNGHWSPTPTCRVACTASPEDMREHNIKLKWTNGDKIYSTDGNVVQFECLRGYKPHPNTRSFRVHCVDGTFDYPSCISNRLNK